MEQQRSVCSGGLGKQDFGPPSSPLVKIPILLIHKENSYLGFAFLSSTRLLSLAYIIQGGTLPNLMSSTVFIEVTRAWHKVIKKIKQMGN